MTHEEHLEHILDEALALLMSGKTVPEILDMFPEYKNELQEYLHISEELSFEKNTNKNILQNILRELPTTTASQIPDTKSYWYGIRENIISQFSLYFSRMKNFHSLASIGVVVILILGGGFLVQKYQSRNLTDDWKFSNSQAYEDSFGGAFGSPAKIGIIDRLKMKFFPSSMMYATSVSAPSSGGSQLMGSAKTAGTLSGAEVFGLANNIEARSPSAARAEAPMRMADDSLGFSVGGAKDINNFRENMKNGFLPLPTDITYEGLFYDYYFDTGKTEKCNNLFCPSYSQATSKDPISGKDEYYLSVGLNSNLTQKDFQRKKLNLVVVLDISGSMESPFNSYYYDKLGFGEENNKKIEIAKKVVANVTKQLKSDDRFGMVLFDDRGYVAKPLSQVGETNMESIRDHIKEIQSQGGTNMSAGMQMGTDLFKDQKNSDESEYENRIIFLTDAMPNTGDISRTGMMGMTQKNADNKIYSTFIGIGVDFNTDLIESITKIRGANYYSVHSDKEFEERVNDQFEYMVTPLVFGLSLNVESQDYEIEKVYGSPEADESTGSIMKVNTLFPSPSKGGETKGGLVLLKLKKIGAGGDIKVNVSYETRDGKKENVNSSVHFSENSTEKYDNLGIRKGILLARYANLLKDWTLDQRETQNTHTKYMWDETNTENRVNPEMGIGVPEIPPQSQWERTSKKLEVSPEYKTMFKKFGEYFETEANALGDATLDQEKEILETLF